MYLHFSIEHLSEFHDEFIPLILCDVPFLSLSKMHSSLVLAFHRFSLLLDIVLSLICQFLSI